MQTSTSSLGRYVAQSDRTQPSDSPRLEYHQERVYGHRPTSALLVLGRRDQILLSLQRTFQLETAICDRRTLFPSCELGQYLPQRKAEMTARLIAKLVCVAQMSPSY